MESGIGTNRRFTWISLTTAMHPKGISCNVVLNMFVCSVLSAEGHSYLLHRMHNTCLVGCHGLQETVPGRTQRVLGGWLLEGLAPRLRLWWRSQMRVGFGMISGCLCVFISGASGRRWYNFEDFQFAFVVAMFWKA